MKIVLRMNLTATKASIPCYLLENKKQYIAEILVSAKKNEINVQIKFQLNTGASCSTTNLKDYKKIISEMPQQSNIKLKLYNQSLVQPTGSTKLYCKAKGVRKKVHFEMVEHASASLLSGRASEALTLIHLNEECILHFDLMPISRNQSLTQEQILQGHHDVFTGLGKLPGTYHIAKDPKVKPLQENPRRIPIQVKDELKTKIEELETMSSVIAKATKPTPGSVMWLQRESRKN